MSFGGFGPLLYPFELLISNARGSLNNRIGLGRDHKEQSAFQAL